MAFGLIGFLTLVGCGGDGGENGSSATTGGGAGERATTTIPLEPEPGGKLIYGMDSESDGWVPANNRWTPSGLNVARAVYDPLAAFDVNGVARPYLAESIEPSEDFTRGRSRCATA